MNINEFGGMKIVVNPLLVPVAKVRLSNDCPCNFEFRVEYNQWLKEFFGTKEVAYQLGLNTMVVSPRTHDQMLKQLKALNR